MRERHHDQWVQWLRKFCQHHWMPLLLGLLATIATLKLWQQLLVQEQLHIQQLVQQEASALELELNRELSKRILSLERIAHRWQASGGTPHALWEADATDYVDHAYGYQAIEWVDNSFHVRWIIPHQGNAAAQNLDLSQEPRRQITLSLARDLRQTLLTHTLSLTQGGKGFLACVPLFIQGQNLRSGREHFDGFIVGVFRFQSLFDTFLKVSPRYRVQIFDRNGLIYHQREVLPSPFSKTVLIQAYGANWQVEVSPTSVLIAEGQSPLPGIVLWAGFVGAWTLAFTVYLGQRSARYIRQVKRINQQLQREIVERQQIEQELRHTETSLRNLSARLELAVQSAQIGIWDWDIINDCLIWNEQMYTLYGVQAADFLGAYQAWTRALHPEDFDRATTAIQQAIRGEKDYNPEFRVVYPDGTIRFIQAYAVVQRDVQGQAQRMIGVNFDITERKHAELVLQESEAKYRQLINHMNAGFVVHAPDTHVVQCNATACKLLGLSMAQLLGRVAIDSAWHFIREDGTVMPVAEYPVNLVLSTQQPLENYVLGIHQENQSQVWVLATAFPEFDANDQLKQVVVTFIDISQQQAALHELRQSKLVLQKYIHDVEDLYNNAPCGYHSLNSEGIIIRINDTELNWLGYTRDEVLNKSFLDFMMPESRQVFYDSFSIFKQQGWINNLEFQLLNKDGSTRWVSINATAIEDETGRFVMSRSTLFEITDRKRIEQERKQTKLALQESENRFRILVTHAPVGIFQTDSQGQCLYVNPRWTELTGLSFTEAMGHGWVQSLHPSDREAIFAEWKQVTEAGRPFTLEYRFQKPDGTVTWVAGRAIAVQDETGAITRYFGTVTDITDRKHAEMALQESEAHFQAFMNHSPAASWITDTQGVILYTSQTYCRTFQLPTTDLIGRSIFDLYSAEVAQQFLDNIQAVARTQQTVEAIEVAPRQDGTMGDFLVYKFPIPDPSGQVLVGGVAIDVTLQHQAEEALKFSEERLQLALEASGDGLWDWDLQTGEVYLSPYYQKMLGYAPNELVMDGSVWENMIHPEDKPWVLERLRNHLQDSSVQYAFDYRVRCKSGEWTWIADYGKVVAWDDKGNPLRMIGTHRDISDRKHKEVLLQQAMESAEAANLAKSIFLANMSHELRTPLNVILGFAQVMGHDASLTPSQKEDLQTIQRSGDHLLSLINDVLDLSKIEAGHCTLEETGFDLIALLHTLRIMMMERAKAKQLQLVFNIAPEVPQFVIADEQKLRQILLNLISNAIKFTQQGSVTLHVTCQKRSDQPYSVLSTNCRGSQPETVADSPSHTLKFEIIDTGIGIASNEQDIIFDAFVQADAGKKSLSGTGLGLTISRRLLELMHGKISVQSVLNLGSTFTVTVPICATSGIDVQPEQHDRVIIGLLPGQPHHRILVVDDQQENRLLMVRLLTQLGLEVREATNGQEAISRWQEWQPDLIWMDIRMPGIDGYEATKQIRTMEQEKTSIIIALTAQASQSDRTLALAAGCNDYISKPFREETIFLKMAEYLGLRYHYADASTLAQTLATQSDLFLKQSLDSSEAASTALPDLAILPQAWLQDLAKAAICGDDGAIADLVEQLPSEFTQAATYLTELASQFQFEQILNLIQIDPLA